MRTTDSVATHAYVGSMPCGCHVAAVVDEPNHPKDVAASVGRFVMDGYSVERVALVDLHDGVVKLARCVHKRTDAMFSEQKKEGSNG